MADSVQMSTWKRIAIRSMLGVFAFAVTLAIIGAVAIWYSGRQEPPQPWNTKALKATYDTIEFTVGSSKAPDGYPVYFYYNVQNNTEKNYDFNPAMLTLMAVLTDGDALSKDFGHYQSGTAVLDGPAFIPPGGTARINLKVSYFYPDGFTQADKSDAKKIIPHLGRRVKELNGFVVFDNRNHYRIDLPRGWKDSEFEGKESKSASQARRVARPSASQQDDNTPTRSTRSYRTGFAGAPSVARRQVGYLWVCVSLTLSKDAGNLVLSLRTILGATRILANGASRPYHGAADSTLIPSRISQGHATEVKQPDYPNRAVNTSATKIGLISDTHGLLRDEARRALEGTDLIIHAGDVGKAEILEALKTLAPVVAVRGNVDNEPWACALPLTAVVEAGSAHIYVLHDIQELDLDPVAAGFHIVVSGHSHQPGRTERKGVLCINPGSAGPRRFHLPVTLARLDLSQTPWRVDFLDLFDKRSGRLEKL